LLFVWVPFYPAHACEKLYVSGATDWRPVAYLVKNTRERRGFAYDVIQMIGKELKIPIILQKEIKPWKRILFEVKEGYIDVVAGIYWTKERSKIYQFSVPFAHIKNVIFVKKGKEFPYEKFEDLIGKTGGNVLGGAIGGGFDEFRKKHLKVQEVSSQTQSFKKLMVDRIDYIPLNYFEGIELIKELGLTEQVSILPKPLTSSPLYIAFSKKSSCISLLPKINEIIRRRQNDGSIDRIIYKYIKKK
jgi:polar amino acid transport system substrate-binding protein